MPSETANFLTRQKAAAFLGRTTKSLDRLRERGVGPAYHVQNHRVLYLLDDLVGWENTKGQRLPPPVRIEPIRAEKKRAKRRNRRLKYAKRRAFYKRALA
jgi:hypothetical protein